MTENSASERLAALVAAMETARHDAPLAAESTTLLAVSKTQPPEQIEPLLAAGHRAFGENRVQEAQAKWPDLRARYPDLRLHLIGPLQTNKLRDALPLFDVIETLDRPKLAAAVAAARRQGNVGITRRFLIQINTGEEPQKAGVVPSDADDFIRYCRDTLELPVTGLMCIPPAVEDPAPHFALLREIALRHGLKELSMGMSGDFAAAIRFGSTEIRIGTALFGARGTT